MLLSREQLRRPRLVSITRERLPYGRFARHRCQASFFLCLAGHGCRAQPRLRPIPALQGKKLFDNRTSRFDLAYVENTRAMQRASVRSRTQRFRWTVWRRTDGFSDPADDCANQLGADVSQELALTELIVLLASRQLSKGNWLVPLSATVGLEIL